MELREKVIKGLECCSDAVSECGKNCPYWNIKNCQLKLQADAIALLKTQEPIPVKYTTSTIRCPKCNKQITSRGSIHKEIKYCWKCGQAVKWE